MTGPLPVQALLLDDNEGESSSMAALLESDELRVTTLPPDSGLETTAEQLADCLAPDRPNVFLLDYRLDDRQDVDFRGGSVASLLKEDHPDVPVVLFTTDDKLHRWVETRPGMGELFDFLLIKADVTGDETRQAAHDKIVDIARGWAQLAAAASSNRDAWDVLAEQMGVARDDLEVFARVEAHPPNPAVPGALALWLLNGPLHWAGPLQGSDDTRVALGITSDAFSGDQVQEWLAFAAYRGPFTHSGPCWWSAMVRSRLADMTGEGTADAAARATTLGQELGVEFPPEGCSWCGGMRTIKACSLCHRAVDAAHSIRRLTGPLPPWAEAPLVCFRCIADGTAEDVRMAPGSEDLVESLREGSIKSPVA